MNPYIGHESQLYGIEEHRLVGGKGDGQRLYQVTNGKGIEMTVSPDRAGDITRLRFKGINMAYMSPCGYVDPAFYNEAEWLRSFTAGYLTTCGLNNVGNPCTDAGEQLPVHGTIANQPSEHSWWVEEDGALVMHMITKDEVIFGRKFKMHRTIAVSTEENCFTITDEITNTGSKVEPFEILYHMNMGYPLLDEDSVITIPSCSVKPRNEHAAEGINDWMHMQKPTPGYEEMCFYHTFADENGAASIYQPKLGIGLNITWNAKDLDCFCEWKMMGVRDYVLGLECGNCTPDGREKTRQDGILKFLEPGETKTYVVKVALEERKA